MGTSESTTISNDLAAVAEKLRQVKLATRRFLALWALEHARDRLRADSDTEVDAALAEFVQHDWSALYDDESEVNDGQTAEP
jgi:ribosomal 50S subunit-associated protein YjgA (DUF615 family)